MTTKALTALASLLAVALAAWFGASNQPQPAPPLVKGGWREVAPGVLRTTRPPHGHALIDGDAALLIDAPRGADGLADWGVKKVEAVWLTHYHRDLVLAAADFVKKGVKVRAPKGAEEWLAPEAVKKFWKESLPLRNSRTAYQVVPVGVEGLDFDLTDGAKAIWRGWSLEAVATPGHARVHLAFLAERKGGPTFAFVGGALAAPGKMWAPYSTDWDHWTDLGLAPAAKSLRRLAALKPDVLLPAHGDVIDKDAVAALVKTAEAAEEAGFLKSFERFTKKRLGNQPEYKFLAKEQKESAGQLPWSQVSKNLWITGNTYVLKSKDGPFLVVDPWGKRSADQIEKLRKDQNLGKLEVVWFSHAHFDHYDGVFDLADEGFQTWMADPAAIPVAEPNRLRAPFLDPRPVKLDKRPKDGESLTWREYRFTFRDFPGQSLFTMGVETVIDGKKCYFTADNFFHQDMFSGSGGWMGLNWTSPLHYAASAKKVLDARPDWVLAEHGGPFEFDAEDFRRRVQWGEETAKACDALSPSGRHQHDWSPHLVRIEPLIFQAKPGDELKGKLVVANAFPAAKNVTVTMQGRGLIEDQAWVANARPNQSAALNVSFRLNEKAPAGRHVFVLRATEVGAPWPCDAVVAVDVK